MTAPKPASPNKEPKEGFWTQTGRRHPKARSPYKQRAKPLRGESGHLSGTTFPFWEAKKGTKFPCYSISRSIYIWRKQHITFVKVAVCWSTTSLLLQFLLKHTTCAPLRDNVFELVALLLRYSTIASLACLLACLLACVCARGSSDWREPVGLLSVHAGRIKHAPNESRISMTYSSPYPKVSSAEPWPQSGQHTFQSKFPSRLDPPDPLATCDNISCQKLQIPLFSESLA